MKYNIEYIEKINDTVFYITIHDKNLHNLFYAKYDIETKQTRYLTSKCVDEHKENYKLIYKYIDYIKSSGFKKRARNCIAKDIMIRK